MQYLARFFVLVSCAIPLAGFKFLSAQGLPNAPEVVQTGHPIPVITGFMSYQSNIGQGNFDIDPEFDPVVLLPLGNRVLLQAEFDMGLDEVRDSGKWGPAVVDHAFDYLQADFFVHPNLTVVAGRYLTPFGIYRERLHPLWIRYLQAEPISFTLNDTSGTGGMLRGGAHVSEGADITYAAYYSASTTPSVIQSDRQAGYRTSLVLLDRHMEIGTSFNHTMGDGTHSMVGTDFTWAPRRVPFEVRTELLFSRQAGNTYWVEGAYKLNRLGRNRLLKSTLLVYRQEQFWLPGYAAGGRTPFGTIANLPDTNNTRSTIGLIMRSMRIFDLTLHIRATSPRMNTVIFGIWA